MRILMVIMWGICAVMIVDSLINSNYTTAMWAGITAIWVGITWMYHTQAARLDKDTKKE